MVLAYSPHREGGGILHAPHNNPNSTFAQLRRSLSKSPSKQPSFRLVTSKSGSLSPSSPLSPSPLSPSHRAATGQSHSPLASPYPVSSKKVRNVLRRTSPKRGSMHLMRSPAKRVLSESSDHGNATPPSFYSSQSTSENSPGDIEMTNENNLLDSDPKPFGSDTFLNPNRVWARRENAKDLFSDAPAKSSPLKRSEGTRDLGQLHAGSPSAKRRSLHGASFGPDFNIFDQAAAFESSNRSSDAHNPLDLASTSTNSPLPRRSSSLRKTTLQQRHDKPIHRAKPEFATFPDSNTPRPGKAHGRMSLDNFQLTPQRDSPFSSQSPLPNASVHPMAKTFTQEPVPNYSRRHPLSKTLTQSSSSSSLAEDSPTHIPTKQPDFKRPNAFAKSLPLGANRPIAKAPATVEQSSQESAGSLSTPDSYKLARPLPAAFMSTGLISKRAKNLDDAQLDLNESIGHMPDTPCKRPASMATIPPFSKPQPSTHKPKVSRHSVHAFGTPSTPFNPHAPRQVSGLGKGMNIFGSSYNQPRRGSFLSDTEENSQSSNTQTQSSNEFDVPPTPTKRASTGQQTHFGHSLHRSNGSFGFRVSVDEETLKQSPEAIRHSKSSIFSIAQEDGDEGDGKGAMEDSPSAQPRFRSFHSIPSFSDRFNKAGQRASPSRKSRAVVPLPFIRVSRNIKTNPSPPSPASPLVESHTPKSPRTPSDAMVPPDPSGLSISARADNKTTNFGSSLSSQPPPATPTNRDSFGRSNGFKDSTTPVHQAVGAEIDASLTSRFTKVEFLGQGEFSQVFRVSSKASVAPQGFPEFDNHPSIVAPMADKIWAVKKAKQPFLGPKDRLKKIQEVEILRALGRSEHIVQYQDSWEFDNHLYIQTEFCEEGTLDLFLKNVGRRARLDDFRMWKVLLELADGLKHIHDSNIIHLDLKPANILITFEGTLKIGDFGMAAYWPAAHGIDCEGDREYIGPEILRGQYDKPADVFALGLIMLEIAGNVVLPDNGDSWRRLRNGDMTDVPSLTFSSASSISRDISGNPLHSPPPEPHRTQTQEQPQTQVANSQADNSDLDFLLVRGDAAKLARASRAGELLEPPEYMTDPDHDEAIDRIVRWMIKPEPAERPVATQLLRTAGVAWVRGRRRAGATIYEGNWGPADEVLQDDAEMVDV